MQFSLENDNDSEFIVKTKNAPFFMNFIEYQQKWQLFSACEVGEI
jgi:hypothetical protein